MNVLEAIKNYVFTAVESIEGMKILLLDKDTTSYVSAAVTQSTLLSKDVFVVDRLDRFSSADNTSDLTLKSLKCLYFIRPTKNNYEFLREELKSPRFGEYHLVFTNLVSKSQLEDLAGFDELEVVKSVKEFYGDYLPINPDLFSLNSNASGYAEPSVSRTVEGLLAVLLSVQLNPSTICVRYEKSSDKAKEIAEKLIQGTTTADFRMTFPIRDSPPLLLILDRQNDPVTPLLTPWTYQAMLHELLGIQNGRVDLSSSPDRSNNSPSEVVLNQEVDPFYRVNRDLNFGDLGTNLKKYVEEYQGTTLDHKAKAVESIADMKRFVEAYPEFRKLAGNVTKHVQLVGELSRLIDANQLLVVSELEQNLACGDQHNENLKELQRLLQSSIISSAAKLRLALLYALRYEKSPSCNMSSDLFPLLDREQRDVVEKIISSSGASKRQNDLFFGEGSGGIGTMLLSKGRQAIRGLQGVDNVYTQHRSLLTRTLDDLVNGKLRDSNFPVLANPSKLMPQEVVIFFVGGATYQEAREIAQFNQQHFPSLRVIIGGSAIINSATFLSKIQPHP